MPPFADFYTQAKARLSQIGGFLNSSYNFFTKKFEELVNLYRKVTMVDLVADSIIFSSFIMHAVGFGFLLICSTIHVSVLLVSQLLGVVVPVLVISIMKPVALLLLNGQNITYLGMIAGCILKLTGPILDALISPILAPIAIKLIPIWAPVAYVALRFIKTIDKILAPVSRPIINVISNLISFIIKVGSKPYNILYRHYPIPGAVPIITYVFSRLDLTVQNMRIRIAENIKNMVLIGAESSNLYLLKLCMEMDGDLANETGAKALCFAAKNNNLPVAKFLIEHGANVNSVTGKNGCTNVTALDWALLHENTELRDILIANGASNIPGIITPFSREVKDALVKRAKRIFSSLDIPLYQGATQNLNRDWPKDLIMQVSTEVLAKEIHSSFNIGFGYSLFLIEKIMRDAVYDPAYTKELEVARENIKAKDEHKLSIALIGSIAECLNNGKSMPIIAENDRRSIFKNKFLPAFKEVVKERGVTYFSAAKRAEVYAKAKVLAVDFAHEPFGRPAIMKAHFAALLA